MVTLAIVATRAIRVIDPIGVYGVEGFVDLLSEAKALSDVAQVISQVSQHRTQRLAAPAISVSPATFASTLPGVVSVAGAMLRSFPAELGY